MRLAPRLPASRFPEGRAVPICTAGGRRRRWWRRPSSAAGEERGESEPLEGAVYGEGVRGRWVWRRRPTAVVGVVVRFPQRSRPAPAGR
jgi:hypothetical protein